MDEDQELIRGINSLRTEVEAGQAFGDLPRLALGLFLFESIDQPDHGEEASLPTVMLNGLDAKGRRHMGFAGARAADQHDVLGTIHELAFVQLAPRSISVASLISLVAKSKPERSL